MPQSIKVIEIELSQPLPTLSGLEGYKAVQALVRLQGVPLGFVKAPIEQAGCSGHRLSRLILDQHHDAIARQLLHNGLAAGLLPQELKLETLMELTPLDRDDWPLVTVAVCWRDCTVDLAVCLNALTQLDYPNLDLLVVDSASTAPAAHLVDRYLTVRYLHTPHLELNQRDRVLLAAKGEIVAFISADARVDRGWAKAIARTFTDNPDAMAVTGLSIPAELDDTLLFEQNGVELDFQQRTDRQAALEQQFVLAEGTIANIAYRRGLFAQLDGFEDRGDRQIGRQGYSSVYQPQAIVWQSPLGNRAQLPDRMFHQGKLAALQVAAESADSRQPQLLLRLAGLFGGQLGRLGRSLIHPAFPRDLIWAELLGGWVGLKQFARRPVQAAMQSLDRSIANLPAIAPTKMIAVRQVELSQPLTPLDDLSDYEAVQIFFTWQHSPIAQVTRPTHPTITLAHLQAAVVESIGLRLLDLDRTESDAVLAAHVLSTLRDRWHLPIAPAAFPAEITVSIVVGTCDRPDTLRQCLASLTAQQSPRSIEIIVVDNRPDSQLTPPIVAEFSNVVLCCEPRAGVAYARNAGISHSQGEIIVTVDDDVVVPPDWLEKLIAPFTRAEVWAVTGNVLPLELDTPAQCLFEQYGNGGLGRGFARFEADRDWFVRSFPFAVPTWELGATANSAFRACIFHDPAIGLMDEALGPGMPSGVGEDIYLFYKILKAGATIVYEPNACVWHQHRRDRSALARQIYGYSKGIVSYHLTTLFNDGDWRAFLSLVVGLPLYYTKRIVLRIFGQTSYPLSLLLTEIGGNLVGAWALWKSHQRVRQQGRSTPYVPLTQRSLPVPAVSSR